jgi:hypothetical protein
MAFVIIWWFVSAKHWFKGPVINVEVRTSLTITTPTSANCVSIICSVEMKLSRVLKGAQTKVQPVLTIRLRNLRRGSRLQWVSKLSSYLTCIVRVDTRIFACLKIVVISISYAKYHTKRETKGPMKT